MKLRILALLPLCLLEYGVCGVCTDGVSLSEMEGESVALNTDVKINQQDGITWFFYDTIIAEIIADLRKICTDVQCKDRDGRFKNRLKLDNQTGSLTIKSARTTDTGVYHLKINRDNKRIFIVTIHDFFSVNTETAFVTRKDSVTLNTGVKTNQQEKIRWYFSNSRIAEITGNQSQICTDDECKERFRDRLKVDNQTGSLTITNTTITDSGIYRLRIMSISGMSERIFIFAVYDDPSADEMKREEGENVTLDTCAVIKQHDVMTWYFNNTFITELTGDPNKTCTDDQCEYVDERFRDRLKVDHQTGSLTIKNTRTTDSGEYKLQINSSRISIIKRFIITVNAVKHSGLSPGAVAGIFVALMVVVVVAVLIFYYRWRSLQAQYGTRRQHNQYEDNWGTHSVKLSDLDLTCENQTEMDIEEKWGNEREAMRGKRPACILR